LQMKYENSSCRNITLTRSSLELIKFLQSAIEQQTDKLSCKLLAMVNIIQK
jgi:hypothetical protein